MSKPRPLSTEKAPKAIGPYSQAILSGEYLFVSGQLPIDPETGKFASDEIKGQTEQVLKNLEAILEEAGLNFSAVVRCDIFLIDLGEFSVVNEVYAKAFSTALPPARQTIQVARLPLGARIEISCIAKISL